jgi:hypothetical protein
MTFEEFKEKAENRFGRELSDKEIAEIALDSLNNANEETESLSEQLESAEREVSELRKSLSTQIPSAMLKQCDEILSIPAESHCITLNFSYDRLPTLDYSVDGIVFPEVSE